jgi:Acyclic terpene utilisation family protein AtuA
VVDCRTVKEQLLYEIHDPAAYLTPDVVADISEAEVKEIGSNRVAVSGVRGHPRPTALKAIVCLAGGWLGEGEISYAGPNALGRARLAAETIRQRVGDRMALRCDLVGVLSVFGDDGGRALAHLPSGDTRDVRLRVAGAHSDRASVEGLLREVTALYTCGPAGGGGVRTLITPRLNSVSCFVPRDVVPASFTFLE